MATGGKTPLSAQSWPQNSHRSLATVGHSRSQADGQQHNPQDSFSCGHSPGTAELTPSARSTPETSHEAGNPPVTCCWVKNSPRATSTGKICRAGVAGTQQATVHAEGKQRSSRSDRFKQDK